MLFDNFLETTKTRGVLKLDFLFNLEFVTCLLFVLIIDQIDDYKDIPEADHSIPVWQQWFIVLLLFFVLAATNYIGGKSTVSQIPLKP